MTVTVANCLAVLLPVPMAATPSPRLIITEHRPYRHLFAGVALLLALITTAAAYWFGGYRAVPEAVELREQTHNLEAERSKTSKRLEHLSQKVATLERSEQIHRDAAQALQVTLAERDAELANLRNDVAFYERLAGGDTQRQPLTVHSLKFESLGDGSWRYRLTLTQNLKRAAISKGQYSLRVEGTQAGKLRTLAWADLVQTEKPAPGEFSFKYFQQIEGSLVLPVDFVPHRVRVIIHSDQGQTEQVMAWSQPPSQE